MNETLQAGLYLIGVPIGTLSDITLRATHALSQMDTIFCEDTRQTAKLLSLLNLPKKPLVSLNDHTEAQKLPQVLSLLSKGQRVGYVSDAGMPLISDPGFRLVSAARDAGFAVTSLPGPSAVLTAVQLSGIVSGPFLFYGFLPAKPAARMTALSSLSNVPAALVFFEAPHRIGKTLSDMTAVFAGRKAALCRELTKKFEEIISFTFPDAPDVSALKGEMVIVVAPPLDVPLDISAFLTDALCTQTLKEAVREAALFSGRSKKEIYAEALKIRNGTHKKTKKDTSIDRKKSE